VVLVDTSLWIDHFRHGVTALARLLEDGRVASHPAVIGELACGTLRERATTLDLLRRLPRAVVASDEEALRFLDQHRLFGRGLGWTDVHLLASTALSQFQLWTVDRRLEEAGRRLRLAFST
jgi:predicted nucleic acid-binding protein